MLLPITHSLVVEKRLCGVLFLAPLLHLYWDMWCCLGMLLLQVGTKISWETLIKLRELVAHVSSFRTKVLWMFLCVIPHSALFRNESMLDCSVRAS